MNQEQQFAATLGEVRKLAGRQGNCIGEKQVREAFAGMNFDEKQLQMVLDYLRGQKIRIKDPGNPDAYLSAEEKGRLDSWLESIRGGEESFEEEKEALFLATMAGEREAGKRLIEQYLPHVADVARLYVGQGALLEDLIGEGNVALATAVEMLGTATSVSEAEGLLGSMIMEAMEAHIAGNAREREAGEKIAEKVNHVADQARELAESLGRKATMQELAEETGMTLLQIMEAVKLSGDAIEDIDTGEKRRG